MNDRPVRDIASLHDSTVRRTHELMAKTRRRPQRSSRVTSIVPDPLVWQTALELAGGDVRRLTVESATSVLVENPRD